MSDPQSQGANGAGCQVGAKRCMTYEDFARQRQAEVLPVRTELEDLTRRQYEAMLAYQATLRALPPKPGYRRDQWGRDVLIDVGRAAGVIAAAPVLETPNYVFAGAATDELTDHNYDGIQEYDNPTPGWWYAVFILTVIFSFFYVIVYHSPLIPSMGARWEIASTRAEERKFAELNQIPMSEDKILQIMAREDWLAKGEAIFAGNCTLCHAAEGQGGIGPNLTDDNYKNADSLLAMADFITAGSANGAMPAKGGANLNDNEIALVAAYTATLRGNNLPTPPGVSPEYTGEPIPPWPELPVPE